MDSAKFDVVYKFLLVFFLLSGMTLVLFSGASLVFGFYHSMLPLHIGAALIFAIALILHIVNRKNKIVKIHTQFMDLLLRNKYPSYCNLDRLIATAEKLSINQICARFQLDQRALLHELEQGRIPIINSAQPLRVLFPHNDEKIFATMSIVLQMSFESEHSSTNLMS